MMSTSFKKTKRERAIELARSIYRLRAERAELNMRLAAAEAELDALITTPGSPSITTLLDEEETMIQAEITSLGSGGVAPMVSENHGEIEDETTTPRRVHQDQSPVDGVPDAEAVTVADPEEDRKESVRFRLTAAEKDLLEAGAARESLSLSSWIRMVMLTRAKLSSVLCVMFIDDFSEGRREESIRIRLTMDEKNLFEAGSARECLDVSSWVRRVMLERARLPVVPSLVAEQSYGG